MYVKTKSWKFKGWGKMYDYINKEESSELQIQLYHNIHEGERENVLSQFQENDQYRVKRKNGVALYHEIISFSPEDRPNLTPEIIEDLTRQWLEERAPNALAYARVHAEKEHVHVHILLSANNYSSAKSTTLRKVEFVRQRENLERYQQEKYGKELSDSLVYTTGKQTPELVDQIRSQVLESVRETNENLSIEETLRNKGLELYKRSGRHQGVIYKGKKYRFKNRLGIDIDSLLSEQKERTEEPVLSPYFQPAKEPTEQELGEESATQQGSPSEFSIQGIVEQRRAELDQICESQQEREREETSLQNPYAAPFIRMLDAEQEDRKTREKAQRERNQAPPDSLSEMYKRESRAIPTHEVYAEDHAPEGRGEKEPTETMSKNEFLSFDNMATFEETSSTWEEITEQEAGEISSSGEGASFDGESLFEGFVMKYLLPPMGKGVEVLEAEREERERKRIMEKESKKRKKELETEAKKERETTADRRRYELQFLQQCREDREQEGRGR